jgi:hypothetical protein
MNMSEYQGNDERDLALALRRLDDAVVVPEVDPAREAALMAAFDAAQAQRRVITRSRGRQYWGMAGLAAAAALMIAIALDPARTGRRGISSDGNRPTHPPPASSVRGVQSDPQPPNEFVIIPGTAGLPALESGSLVRMNLPVSVLPSMGVTPPQGRATAVRADVIVGQDGVARAVRLVD